MQRNIILVALFLSAFAFSSLGSVSNADALGSYGCYNDDRRAHLDCLRGKLDSTAYGLTIPKDSRGLGNYGCGVRDRRAHQDCLRDLLDMHGSYLQVRNPGTNTYEGPATDGNSGSNYNHLRDPLATGGVNGVEANNHSCTQFSGAPRRACEAAANTPVHGSDVQMNHCATFNGAPRRACEAAITRNP